MVFYIFIGLLIILRLTELALNARNEKWLRAHGAIQYGQKHYPYIVALHTLFIISLIIEYNVKHSVHANYYLIVFFILLIICKGVVISTLGKYWSTKIYHIPGHLPVNKGIYKYIKHPNYMIVIAEIAVIPLAFNLYYTALIFSVLNGIMLYVRISIENKVLREV